MFLSEVLTEMRRLDSEKNPIPFSISVRTFSRKDFSGGELKTLRSVTLLQAPKIKGVQRLADDTPFRNPHHWENRTLNVKDAHGSITKINTMFIINYNGYDVIY